VKDPDRLVQYLNQPGIHINVFKHYRQYDDYFFFDDTSQGRLRFREDDLINTKGEVANVRSRLTLIGQKREERLGQDVLLSRSRFLAPASHTLRFYREYFTPQTEVSIKKDRQRWHIQYKNTEFFVNLDHIEEPEMGYFLEIKSRTWSRNDAERKADLLGELLTLLGENEAESVLQDYIEIINAQE
jgi:5-methylthioadenosine/S-adenosylhomocysteine deaminase